VGGSVPLRHSASAFFALGAMFRGRNARRSIRSLARRALPCSQMKTANTSIATPAVGADRPAERNCASAPSHHGACGTRPASTGRS